MIESRNFTYMFYGFLAAWTVLVLYVVSLVARERKIKQELDRLKNMIQERERK